jgi:hypothetical protein
MVPPTPNFTRFFMAECASRSSSAADRAKPDDTIISLEFNARDLRAGTQAWQTVSGISHSECRSFAASSQIRNDAARASRAPLTARSCR